MRVLNLSVQRAAPNSPAQQKSSLSCLKLFLPLVAAGALNCGGSGHGTERDGGNETLGDRVGCDQPSFTRTVRLNDVLTYCTIRFELRGVEERCSYIDARDPTNLEAGYFEFLRLGFDGSATVSATLGNRIYRLETVDINFVMHDSPENSVTINFSMDGLTGQINGTSSCE